MSINLDDTNRILQETLKPDHYADPVIIRFIMNFLRFLHMPTACKESNIGITSGRNIMNMKDVQDAIQRLNQMTAAKHGFKAESLIRQIEEMNESNIADCLNPDGTVKPINEMPEYLQRSIREFKVKETWDYDMNGVKYQSGRIVEVKLHDKIKTAELLGRNENIFKPTTVVEHDIGRNAAALLHGSLNRGQAHMEQIAARNVTPVIAQGSDTDE